MPYPMQCALCSVVWHRETSDAMPPPDPPHNHTQADWDAYIATRSDLGSGSTPPFWIKIAGETYPPLPDWPPELGSPPPNYPPAGATTMSQQPDFKRGESPSSLGRLRASLFPQATSPFRGPSPDAPPGSPKQE